MPQLGQVCREWLPRIRMRGYLGFGFFGLAMERTPFIGGFACWWRVCHKRVIRTMVGLAQNLEKISKIRNRDLTSRETISGRISAGIFQAGFL